MSFKIIILNEKLFKSVAAFKSLTDFEIKHKLLAEVVRSEMMNFRSGNAHTKTRAEVRGGGKKPWRQKGTGRARHGSTRSPIWVGGGVTFGPRNKTNWSRKINKSAKVSALKSILKDRLSDKKVFIFDSVDFPKTKSAIELLDKISDKSKTSRKSSIILYTSEDKEKLNGFLSSGARLMNAANLKIVNLVNSHNLVFTPKALDILEEKLAN
ncbi:MAG: 50S ribosomal protein L4 [Patescibacteria group bacterium]